MYRFHHILALLCLMLPCCLSSQGAVVTDTVFSAQKDRVIITYDISYNDNKVTIRFLDAIKKLGGSNKDKFTKLSEVKVAFFDRVGNYSDNAKFKDKSPKAFTVPAYAHYQRSREGYFIINN